jgi:methylenetetrahydrofolate dehydrogenase (NADP+)/methenyltetrahydrofolate cyclohydrolase
LLALDRKAQPRSLHGILVQLPLPKSLHIETVINAIDPAKDVDGLIRTMPDGLPLALRR